MARHRRKNRFSYNYSSQLYLDRVCRRVYTDLKKRCTRRDKVLLDSGFYDTEAWGGLRKCWKGYKIARQDSDTSKMFYYAKGIRKFERELGVPVMDFPQFGLIGQFVDQEREPDNNMKSGIYSQTEIRNYEQREQLEYPYRMEHEPDPWKEQEEYMQRRGRECI